MKCTSCGESIDDDSLYCEYCGSKVETEEELSTCCEEEEKLCTYGGEEELSNFDTLVGNKRRGIGLGMFASNPKESWILGKLDPSWSNEQVIVHCINKILEGYNNGLKHGVMCVRALSRVNALISVISGSNKDEYMQSQVSLMQYKKHMQDGAGIKHSMEKSGCKNCEEYVESVVKKDTNLTNNIIFIYSMYVRDGMVGEA